jgi:hypothetical protein
LQGTIYLLVIAKDVVMVVQVVVLTTAIHVFQATIWLEMIALHALRVAQHVLLMPLTLAVHAHQDTIVI